MRRSLVLTAATLAIAAVACGDGGGPEGYDAAAAAPDTATADRAVVTATPGPALAVGDTLSATLRDPAGAEVGRVTLIGTPNGLLVEAGFDGLPPGEHAFHLHETGACEPDFAAAGGHLNPEGRAHGILSPDGMHAGDMPNVHVPDSGRLLVEVFATRASVEAIEDDDGAAVVVHAGPDDYVTDPAGAAGERIACGVIG